APPATLAVQSMPGDIASGEARAAKPACRLGLLDTPEFWLSKLSVGTVLSQFSCSAVDAPKMT
ncbi:hypothetical protein NKI94_31640, partial [Mesorhizobium australicum]|uniref:hypothetical protein n=1 Tax=Mesorhizobium australicum TaxID=536018 RepID=UPI0033366209